MEEITCPSGLRGVIRRLKVRDEEIITDVRLIRTGQMLTRLVAAVWTETRDRGPYPGTGAIDWAKTAAADRLHAIFQCRVLTYGSDYTFETECAETACKSKLEHSVDLGTMPARPMSEGIKQGIATGVWPTFALDDGRCVHYRCMLGVDDVYLTKVEPQKASLYALARRVVAIDGVNDSSTDILAALQDISIRDAVTLRQTVDDAEGGYITNIEIPCTRCGASQETILPFGQEFFFGQKLSSRRTRATTHPATTTPPGVPGPTG